MEHHYEPRYYIRYACSAATISNIPIPLAIVTLSSRMFSNQFKKETLVFCVQDKRIDYPYI